MLKIAKSSYFIRFLIFTVFSLLTFDLTAATEKLSASVKLVQTHESLLNYQLMTKQLLAYHDGGEYTNDLNEISKNAIAYIQKRSKETDKKLAVVFDIDDTLLSNWAFVQENHFYFDTNKYRSWAEKADAPLVKPIYEVYKAALTNNIHVFLITGRREYLRSATIKNLYKQGISKWDNLYLKPIQQKPDENATTYKTALRKKIAAQGYDIILTMGDQYSDLCGGYADQLYKLPNPFYYLPGCSADWICSQPAQKAAFGKQWLNTCKALYQS